MLFLLMPVLPQTLFAFVGSHLMSFSFFTAWHGKLLLNVRLNFCDKRFCRFKGRNIMCRDYDGCILGNIPCSFLCPFLNYEAPETSQIYVITGNHRMFYSFHQCFNSLLDRHLFYTSILGNFINNVCFSHFLEV